MGERKRYPARDLVRARRKLRSDAEQMAERGLRPGWMVWLPVQRGWWGRRRGELVVQYERVGAGSAAGEDLGPLLQPLVWRLHQLVRDQAAVQRTLRSGDPERRGEVDRARRRLEVTLREVELELARLESLES